MPSQGFLYSSHHGYHYVLYADGKRSGLMKRSIAQDYAEIFGGTVHKVRKIRTPGWWIFGPVVDLEYTDPMYLKEKNQTTSNQ